MSNLSRYFLLFRRNKLAVVGAIGIIIVILLAIFANQLSPHDPLTQNILQRLNGPNSAYPFGTDRFGRGIFSRILFASRISLITGVLSVLMGSLIGGAAGIVAAYEGGYYEGLIMRGVDILLSFPSLLLGLMVAAVIGRGLDKLIIAIGIALTPRFARIAHGAALNIKEKDYLEAARALGADDTRITTCHILPNIFGELLVSATLWIGTAIRIEANLSFIGLGVTPPTPTWGNMINGGLSWVNNAPWVALFPGLAIFITILSINMVGDGMRDITDPRLRG